MNLDPAPRLNKMVFLAIDGCLLLTAFVVVFFAKDPYAPLPFVTAVLCVVAAAAVGLVPFFVDYSAKYDEYVQAEQLRVAEQAQRLHAATESLNRAAAQIKAVEEAVQKSAHAAENLPYRMQEKLAEFNEALAAKDSEDRDALERELEELRGANSDQLKSVADKIAKTAGEWSAIETAARKQLAAVQESSTKLNDQFKTTLAELDRRIAELAKVAASVPTTVTVAPAPAPIAAAPVVESSPAAPTAPEPIAHKPAAPAEPEPVAITPEPAPSVAPEPPAAPSPIESVTFTESAPAATPEEPKPKKPRAPRKARAEDTLAAMSAEPVAETPAAPAPESEPISSSAASNDDSSSSADYAAENTTKAEAAASSDGATRLLVTAYIGIGNKLFLRGEGPGLSWDKGVPMQFVSIGKWGWASHDVTAPMKCKLYKNDEVLALSGDVTLEPGKHIELTALF